MIQRPVFIMLILFVIALAMSHIIFPYLLKIAKSKKLVDCPDGRKLQKEPVPVVGGLAVFFGIVVSLCFFKTTVNRVDLFATVCAMMVMLYLGCIDDILDISARIKFTVQILVSILIIYGTHNLMTDFQGLFSVEVLPLWAAMPLTVFGMVGIINAINLIDGVDGLSSGMCIFICGCLALLLFLAHEYSYCALAVICAGALIPFFYHNVWGGDTKMYIGDGGALMLGTAISAMVLNVTKGHGLAYTAFVPDISRLSLISFCLAVLSIPVFDTLRVMAVRISHGISPFYADRRHLHHLLMDRAGLTPVWTAVTEIALDALVVALWLISYLLGAGVTLQFIVVLAAGLLFTSGLTIVICRVFSPREG